MNITENQKHLLGVLEKAIANNVKIAMNHKYKYYGHKLGSFLINAKYRKNKDLYNKIESLGFSYKRHSKDPIDGLENFIHDLWNDPKPFKGAYITKFNTYIIQKKKIYPKELKEELNVVWKIKFGDKRIWKKPVSQRQRVNEWKKIRYDKELNPEGKWFLPLAKIGNFYYWIYNRKRKKHLMNIVIKYFSEQEVNELITEGFKFDNPYYKKPTFKRVKRNEKVMFSQ